MNCVQRVGVYAFLLGFTVFSLGAVAHAKGDKDHATVANNTSSYNNVYSAPVAPEEFMWNDHTKLSWDDFRGPVTASSDESAAATHCSIGFKTIGGNNGKPQVVVYNKFYTNRSWVRSDAKIQGILDHEQGHFDLCEIYTRKLRERMSDFNFDVADVKTALMDIYTHLQDEYENRQQAYEQETSHGTNIANQKRWQETISKELAIANTK